MFCISSWGANSSGQCGTGDTMDYCLPKRVFSLDRKPLKVTGGGYHSFIVTENELYFCGGNDAGQLGSGNDAGRGNVLIFTPSSFAFSIVDVACGWNHSLMLNCKGDLYVCGSNQFGQLGLGRDIKMIGCWTFLNCDFKFRCIAAGVRHSLAITDRGKLYGWGDNKFRKCVNDTSATRIFQPQLCNFDLKIGEEFVSVSAGHQHSVALTNHGRVFLFGSNRFNQIGKDDVNVIDGDFVKIGCGWHCSFALARDGKSLLIGRNDVGQLGSGRSYENLVFGSEHSLGIIDGVVEAFGWNEHGCLGTGDQVDRFEAVSVRNLGHVALIGCGYSNSFAVNTC